MKNLFILFLFLCTSVILDAQFRMVGVGSWSTVDDSTYTATVNFEADLTGNSYLATQIINGYRVFTGTEQLYTISNVANATFSSAELTVIEYQGDHGAPIGQVMVFNPDGRETLPQVPFGSTGSTAQIQAAIDTYNARLESGVPENIYNTSDTVSGTRIVQLGDGPGDNITFTKTDRGFLGTGTMRISNKLDYQSNPIAGQGEALDLSVSDTDSVNLDEASVNVVPLEVRGDLRYSDGIGTWNNVESTTQANVAGTDNELSAQSIRGWYNRMNLEETIHTTFDVTGLETRMRLYPWQNDTLDFGWLYGHVINITSDSGNVDNNLINVRNDMVGLYINNLGSGAAGPISVQGNTYSIFSNNAFPVRIDAYGNGNYVDTAANYVLVANTSGEIGEYVLDSLLAVGGDGDGTKDPAYGELYTDIAADTIILDNSASKTIVFESQGISDKVTLTDSTMTVTIAGDYEIDYSITYAVLSATAGSCANTTFGIDKNGTLVSEGSTHGSYRHTTDGNAYYPVSGVKKLSLSASDVLKLRAIGSCTDHDIKIVRATFGVKKLN